MSIEVWVDDRPAGTLVKQVRPGFQTESLAFTYLDSWLADAQSFAISPDLPLQHGPQEPAPHRTTFRAFDDATPDRWGRGLVNLGASQDARQRGVRRKPLSEIELLLSVSDEVRQGALRFRTNGASLAPKPGAADIGDLGKLARAAANFADGEPDDMRELIVAGSAPGGARPKVWARDSEGLLLTKFPHPSDRRDVSAWELAMVKLQRRAGIQVQDSWTVPFREGESIFLTRRFDRVGEHRIPYMSFRTVFTYADQERPDYATLARRLTGISGAPRQDAGELFSRAALTVLVNNIDDHMRNHGLLHDGNGWRLSPSFDVNPYGAGSSDTPLTPEDDPGDRDIRLLVKEADSFLLTRGEAVERLRTVERAVSHWREDAVSSGVDPDALGAMAGVFESANRSRIRGMASVS